MLRWSSTTRTSALGNAGGLASAAGASRGCDPREGVMRVEPRGGVCEAIGGILSEGGTLARRRRSGRRVGGQQQVERGAALAVRHADRAPVALEDALDHRQAQPSAGGLGGAARLA